jgi:hypothetical protein
MFLIRLIYASKISPTFPYEEINSIVSTSESNNKLVNVTGVLCYSNKYFLQCLEGTRDNVNSLYDKILKDKRHYDATILKYDEVAEREFNDWSMGYIPPAKFSEALVTKFSGEKDFNPYNMNGDRCHKLLKALRDKKAMNN